MTNSNRPIRILSAAALALLAVGASGAARAEWLSEAWSDDSVAKHGSPSITVGRAGDVEVVLPQGVLQSAQSAGATAEGAVRAFLERYAPRMCSHLINFNEPHKGLRVELRVEAPLFRAAPLFVVSPQHRELVIDYMPENRARCVVPGENASS